MLRKITLAFALTLAFHPASLLAKPAHSAKAPSSKAAHAKATTTHKTASSSKAKSNSKVALNKAASVKVSSKNGQKHLAQKHEKSKKIAQSKKFTVAQRAPRIVPAAHSTLSYSYENSARDAFTENGMPQVQSSSYLVVDQETGRTILERHPNIVLPIASITKLMTAMVLLDARQPLSDTLTISEDDVDMLKGSSSRVPVGASMTREDALRLALMSSENRAASLLARYYPGGKSAFVKAMNIKTQMLGAMDTTFYDSTGLNPSNVSTAYDLMKIVSAASHYPLIREFTTTNEYAMHFGSRTVQFHNTNGLVNSPDWEIGVSKTGYISEAGRCLVMQTWVQGRSLIMVLLDSNGKYTRTADAIRIKQWLETSGQARIAKLERPSLEN